MRKKYVFVVIVLLASLIVVSCNNESQVPTENSEKGESSNVERNLGEVSDGYTNKEPLPEKDQALAEVMPQEETPSVCGTKPSNVVLKTTDNIALEADYYPAKKVDSPAIVFLHMVPPANDRNNYPRKFLEKLHQLNGGVNIINIDRRGAGKSGGNAIEAYTGTKGKLDVEAAVKFLFSNKACKADPEKLVLVGASNGSTSILDYMLGKIDNELPQPKAVIWLSPGTYTEKQHKLRVNNGTGSKVLQPALGKISFLLVYPDSEPWSEQFEGLSMLWWHHKIKDGKHGTKNFDGGALEKDLTTRLETFLEMQLKDK